MTFTAEETDKLERIAKAMLAGMDILAAAGVPADDVAVAHMAEGSVAILNHIHPEGEPVARQS
jgi:hypothetical protein